MIIKKVSLNGTQIHHISHALFTLSLLCIIISYYHVMVLMAINRFKTYEGETMPVLATMRERQLLRPISSMEPVDIVWNNIKALFTKPSTTASTAAPAPATANGAAATGGANVAIIPPPDGKSLEVVFVLGGPGSGKVYPSSHCHDYDYITNNDMLNNK
jgi:hypothetical protein